MRKYRSRSTRAFPRDTWLASGLRPTGFRVLILTVAFLILGFAGQAAALECPTVQPPAGTQKIQVETRSLSEWTDLMKRIEPRSDVAPEIVEGLRALLNDAQQSDVIRRQAAVTLGRIGKSARSAVPDLERILNSSDSEETRSWCLKGLSLFGSEAASATDAVIAVLQNSESSFVERAGAIDVLSQIGSANSGAIPALMALLPDRSRSGVLSEYEQTQQRVLAAESIALIGAAASSSIPALIDGTRDSHESMRRASVVALGRFGSAADAAVTALWDSATYDESEAVRDEAVRSLSAVGPRGLKVLHRLLSDEDWAIRIRAVEAFSDRKDHSVETLQLLKQRLLDPEVRVRLAAVQILIAEKELLSECEQILVQAISSEDRGARMEASKLIVEFLSDSPTIKGQLRKLVDSRDRAVRQSAQRTLQKLEKRQ